MKYPTYTTPALLWEIVLHAIVILAFQITAVLTCVLVFPPIFILSGCRFKNGKKFKDIPPLMNNQVVIAYYKFCLARAKSKTQ